MSLIKQSPYNNMKVDTKDRMVKYPSKGLVSCNYFTLCCFQGSYFVVVFVRFPSYITSDVWTRDLVCSELYLPIRIYDQTAVYSTAYITIIFSFGMWIM